MKVRIGKCLLAVVMSVIILAGGDLVRAEKVEAGKTAHLNKGSYVGGVDIPVGKYVLNCETGEHDYGIVWLSLATDNLEESYPSLIYEFVNSNNKAVFYISLREGGTLNVPFSAKLTAIADYTFESGEEELYAGQYEVGVDIPAGSYEIACRPSADQSYGIVWASAPGDDLKEGYPSILYDYVSSEETMHVTLSEGGKLELPFSCTLTQTTGGVAFY